MSSAIDPAELTPVREADYLEQDPPIRGQRYACISFVSAKDAVLASKAAYAAHKFLSTVAKDVGETLDNVAASGSLAADTVRMLRERHAYLWDEQAAQTEFALFNAQGAEEIERGFREAHGTLGGTSVHGFKIRGSYDTLEEARARGKAVKRFDEKFHVFVSEVGCWCPWSPNADELKDTEYAETQLNTLVKKYGEGQDARDEVYQTRKDDSVSRMHAEKEVWVERMRAEAAARDKAKAEEDARSAVDAAVEAVEAVDASIQAVEAVEVGSAAAVVSIVDELPPN